MAKQNKNIIAIIATIIVASIIGIFFYAKNFYDKLSFDFKPSGNLGNILSDLISTQNSSKGFGLYLDIPIKTIIDNLNSIGINIKDLFAQIKYDNEIVLRTKPDSVVLENVNIPANTENIEINDTVEILVNPSSIKLISQLIAKNKPEVEITLKGRSLGFPFRKTFKQNLEY